MPLSKRAANAWATFLSIVIFLIVLGSIWLTGGLSYWLLLTCGAGIILLREILFSERAVGQMKPWRRAARYIVLLATVPLVSYVVVMGTVQIMEQKLGW